VDLLSSLARNQTTDQPVIFLLELIGNDVCSGHHDFDHMTTVPEFRKNILAALQVLDTMLPKGSHVAMMGLAKGV
jgi:acyloxyacyl hydrolase